MIEPKFVEELPPDGRGKWTQTESAAIAAALRDRPGVWAELARSEPPGRNALNTRGYRLRRLFPDLEAATRTVDGQVVLYVRSVQS